MSITGNENLSTSIQSLKFNGTVLNIVSKNGIYKIAQCKTTEIEIAINNHGLAQIPIVNNEESSLKAFKALSISIITNTDNDNVLAVYLPTVKYVHGFFEKSYLPKL